MKEIALYLELLRLVLGLVKFLYVPASRRQGDVGRLHDHQDELYEGGDLVS